jgi:hypothetical protein
MWRLPWISRSSHEAIVNLLTSQLSEQKAERTILLDRLALLGLGGTLFSLPPSQDSSPATEAEEELTEEEQDRLTMESLRRTPSKLAKFIEWKMKRDRNKIYRGPDVAYITPEPQQVAKVNAALEQAEQQAKSMTGAEFVKSVLGRKQA